MIGSVARLLCLTALAAAPQPMGPAAPGASGGADDAPVSMALLGMPLVATPGGWARYLKDGPDGAVQFVVRVGAEESVGGRRGRWIVLELEVPGVGRVRLETLIAGSTSEPGNILRTAVTVPGHKRKVEEERVEPGSAPARPIPKPVVLRKATREVLGRKMEVTTWELDSRELVDWSPSVPGFGVVRLDGTEPMRLVAFGLGGDPWAGASRTGVWNPDPLKPE